MVQTKWFFKQNWFFEIKKSLFKLKNYSFDHIKDSFKLVIVPKIRSGKESFSMILRLVMILSVVSYENIIFYEQNLKHTINITFNNVFCNRIFFHHRFLPMFWIRFSQIMAYFSGKIFSISLLSTTLKVKFPVAEILKIIFEIAVFEGFLLNFEIKNCRLVENIFPEKISHTEKNSAIKFIELFKSWGYRHLWNWVLENLKNFSE